MKKSIVISLAALLLLTGCGDSSSSESISTTVTAKETKVSLEVLAPGKLTATVTDGNIRTNWNAVSGATAYECCFEGSKDTFTTENPTFAINNAPEGLVTVKVRCIMDTSDGRLYSEWTTEKVKVPYTVGQPGDLVLTLDGTYIMTSWEAGKNADSYEYSYKDDLDTKTYEVKKNSLGLQYAKEGLDYLIKVRSVRNTDDGVIYSDWKQATISVPKIDSSDFGFLSASFLDVNQITYWAKNKDYSYDVAETKDENGNAQTVVTVHFKDEKNSGFFNSAGRILESAIVGFFGGYSEQLKDDYSSVEKIVNGYVAAGSLSEYANTFDQNATQAGKESAFTNALNALLLDTDIYYQYYYSHPSKGADLCTAYLLENNRENYESTNFGDFKKSSDGSYHLMNTIFNKSYNVSVAEVASNGFKKWAIVVVPQK